MSKLTKKYKAKSRRKSHKKMRKTHKNSISVWGGSEFGSETPSDRILRGRPLPIMSPSSSEKSAAASPAVEDAEPVIESIEIETDLSLNDGTTDIHSIGPTVVHSVEHQSPGVGSPGTADIDYLEGIVIRNDFFSIMQSRSHVPISQSVTFKQGIDISSFYHLTTLNMLAIDLDETLSTTHTSNIGINTYQFNPTLAALVTQFLKENKYVVVLTLSVHLGSTIKESIRQRLLRQDAVPPGLDDLDDKINKQLLVISRGDICSSKHYQNVIQTATYKGIYVDGDPHSPPNKLGYLYLCLYLLLTNVKSKPRFSVKNIGFIDDDISNCQLFASHYIHTLNWTPRIATGVPDDGATSAAAAAACPAPGASSAAAAAAGPDPGATSAGDAAIVPHIHSNKKPRTRSSIDEG